jgi:hypothetical protein
MPFAVTKNERLILAALAGLLALFLLVVLA